MKSYLLISLFLVFSCAENRVFNYKTSKEKVNFAFRSDSPSLKNEQVFCDENNSCLEGKCLPRGDGYKVCFRSGANGEVCRKASDCQGGICTNRGDGIHVCMGNGIEGDFCRSDNMCSIGSCKDASDIFKVCLK